MSDPIRTLGVLRTVRQHENLMLHFGAMRTMGWAIVAMLLCLMSTTALHSAEPVTELLAQKVLTKDSPAQGVLDRENLVAWCIVPFDAKKRSPSERAQMLNELGLKRCAYDWRAEHVASFEEEIQQYAKHKIEFFAFWSTHESAFSLFEKYHLHPQIWQTLAAPKEAVGEDRVEPTAQAMVPLAKRTAAMKCPLGLYNHGGWGGEPANMVAVCRRLRELGYEHVGIVYNFHHGHDAIADWKASWTLMKPFVICLNINGMNDKAEPKILGLGKGKHEIEMLRVVIDSGYTGPIGILDHRNELDSRESLQENLDGLDGLREQLEAIAVR
ncbi:MAG: hypothetical protein R3C01_11855 [Planctomycetaceae bacterium]